MTTPPTRSAPRGPRPKSGTTRHAGNVISRRSPTTDAPRDDERAASQPVKFGALGYRTYNLGDEIQSLAAMRFLPQIDYSIDRDTLGDFQSESGEPVAMILNGWYSHRPEAWPPSSQIRPLLISMHFSPVDCGVGELAAADYFLQDPLADYLREHGPVGARDLHTLERLEKANVPAYFSGCMTLTLQRTSDAPRGPDIVLNDVPDDVVAHVRRSSQRNLVLTTHTDVTTPAGEARFERARSLLRTYEKAHLVITTRLHCFLPCLAMGVPVLWLKVGQEGSRFPGLDSLVRKASPADFIAGRVTFDLEHPEANADDYKKLRAALEATASTFIDRAGDASPSADAPDPSAERRFQTLLHLHSHVKSRLAAERAARAEETTKLQTTIAELKRTEAELRAKLARSESDRATLVANLDAIVRSDSFKTTQQLKSLASRLPGATRVAREVMQKLPRRRR